MNQIHEIGRGLLGARPLPPKLLRRLPRVTNPWRRRGFLVGAIIRTGRHPARGFGRRLAK
jgi:hypothetical protein